MVRGGVKMSTDAEKRAVLKYQRSRDNLMVRPTKEEGQRIREHAAAAGDSVQGYILDAVRERMDREDQEKAQTERPRTDEEEDRDGIL